MKTQWIRFGVVTLVALTLACNGSDITKTASPVALLVTNTQTLQHIDIGGGTNCDQEAGTILMQAILKNPNNVSPNQTLNQVRIKSYQVSYQRTDGGKTIPQPFVRTMDALITAGAGATGGKFIILQPDALLQAPFAALYPNNGGKDPDTGKAFIQMDVIVDVFGETLAGEKVSGSTRMPFTFCYNCGGCA